MTQKLAHTIVADPLEIVHKREFELEERLQEANRESERIVKQAEAEAREIIKKSRREAREYVDAAYQEFITKAKAETERQKDANIDKLEEVRRRGEQNLPKLTEYIIALATNRDYS